MSCSRGLAHVHSRPGRPRRAQGRVETSGISRKGVAAFETVGEGVQEGRAGTGRRRPQLRGWPVVGQDDPGVRGAAPGEVRGVKGVFLANQKTNGKVVTLITYNKGRDWDRLRPPSTDMNGKPTNCEPPDCHLHLHLRWADNPYVSGTVHTKDTAPGLIMGAGNLGSQLVEYKEEMYITSDCGHTWRQVRMRRPGTFRPHSMETPPPPAESGLGLPEADISSLES
uniref:uncharacterized protein LOC132693153 n=1 Tax=Panthera onca TaxID=9690 RepID=UPI002953284A|nr:uncharacterized protein LOC132693153 [Panthera onca]